MLTFLKPVIQQVKGTKYQDAYLKPGEPIGIKHLCANGVKAALKMELELLASMKIILDIYPNKK